MVAVAPPDAEPDTRNLRVVCSEEQSQQSRKRADDHPNVSCRSLSLASSKKFAAKVPRQVLRLSPGVDVRCVSEILTSFTHAEETTTVRLLSSQISPMPVPKKKVK